MRKDQIILKIRTYVHMTLDMHNSLVSKILPLAGQGVEILCKKEYKAAVFIAVYQCPGCFYYPEINLKQLLHKYFLRQMEYF